MKIAIDVDDCISNSAEVDFATCWEFNQELNPDDNKLYFGNSNNAPKLFGFDKVLADEFFIKQRKMTIEENLIQPKVFAKKIINRLIDEGNEITILTSRTDMCWGDSLKETKKWLDLHGICYNKCVANISDKGQYCKDNGIELMIEDNPKFVKQVNDRDIKSILILADFNKDYKHELNYFASCWPEVYKIITQLKNS